MRLATNLSAVITRVGRLQTHDIPRAVRAALKPEPWHPLAVETAEKALRNLPGLDPAHEPFIKDFIATITASAFGEGMRLAMRTPVALRASDFTVKDFQGAHSAVSGADLNQNLFLKDLVAFEAMMAEWVATEKNKDQRDAGKTDEDIGNFIAYALLTDAGGQMVVKEGKNKGRLVRDVFLPHIVEWLKKKQAAPVAPEIIEAWLRTVLAAWTEMVRAYFPGRFRAALGTARAELAL